MAAVAGIQVAIVTLLPVLHNSISRLALSPRGAWFQEALLLPDFLGTLSHDAEPVPLALLWLLSRRLGSTLTHCHSFLPSTDPQKHSLQGTPQLSHLPRIQRGKHQPKSRTSNLQTQDKYQQGIFQISYPQMPTHQCKNTNTNSREKMFPSGISSPIAVGSEKCNIDEGHDKDFKITIMNIF